MSDGGVTEFCSILGKMSNLRLISLDRKAAWIFLCPSALLRGRTSCRRGPHAIARTFTHINEK
eukprot:6484647-Amphidinium_carterae.1